MTWSIWLVEIRRENSILILKMPFREKAIVLPRLRRITWVSFFMEKPPLPSWVSRVIFLLRYAQLVKSGSSVSCTMCHLWDLKTVQMLRFALTKAWSMNSGVPFQVQLSRQFQELLKIVLKQPKSNTVAQNREIIKSTLKLLPISRSL